MKLLALTAGAADMYCGSCLRDNALAAGLMARGHDVVLMPIYTPTLTDETSTCASSCAQTWARPARQREADHVMFASWS